MHGRVSLLFALLLLLPRGSAAQTGTAQTRDTMAAAPAAPAGAPVILGRDTILIVRERLGSFTAAERAAAMRQRLERLTNDPLARGDSVAVVESEGTSDIVYGDRVLLTVTEADAAAVGSTRQALAAEYLSNVRQAMAQQGFTTKLRTIALGVLFALVATLVTIGIIRLVQRFFPRMIAAIEHGRTTWMPAIRFQKLELASADRLTDILLWLAKVVRIVVIALLLYLAIPIILSAFPWTQAYADRLFDFILTPFASVWAAFIAFVPDMFTIGAIVIVTWYLLKLIKLFFTGIERGSITLPGFYTEWATPTYQLVRTLVILFALVAIFPYLPGSGSPAFQGLGVFVGLLVSLGSASAVGNVVGGVVLTYMRPFRIGDRVKIADTVGDVVERNLLVTRIRTIKNVDITIPNAMVLSSHIVNYSSSSADHVLILHTTVTIGYDAPWKQVHELLLAAARAVPELRSDPAPFVLQTSLDDFYVSYELNAFTDQPNQMAAIYSALHSQIQDKFNEGGVEIMSPHYGAMRDGNQSTIPARYLPADYEAPSFRLAPQGGARVGELTGDGRGEEPSRAR